MHNFHHSDPGNRDNCYRRKPGDGITFCHLFSGSLEGSLIPVKMGISEWISRGVRGRGAQGTEAAGEHRMLQAGRKMRDRETVDCLQHHRKKL